MKLSRGVIKLGLHLCTVATVVVLWYPRIAVWIADIGDWLSAFGVKLMCYGH